YDELLAREQAFHIRRHAFASVVQRDRPDTLLPFRGYGPPVPVPGRHARRDFRRPLFDPEFQVHLLSELEGHRAVALDKTLRPSASRIIAARLPRNGMSTTSSAASRSPWPAKGLAAIFHYAATSNRRAAVALLLVCLLGFLPGIFQIPPVDRDEAYF